MSDERRIMDDEIVVGLRRARALIERRQQWARGYTCGGSLGKLARCAVMAVVDAHLDESYSSVVQKLAVALPADYPVSMDGVICYNDTHTHAEVLALFDRAIAMRLEELGCQSAARTT